MKKKLAYILPFLILLLFLFIRGENKISIKVNDRLVIGKMQLIPSLCKIEVYTENGNGRKFCNKYNRKLINYKYLSKMKAIKKYEDLKQKYGLPVFEYYDDQKACLMGIYFQYGYDFSAPGWFLDRRILNVSIDKKGNIQEVSEEYINKP